MVDLQKKVAFKGKGNIETVATGNPSPTGVPEPSQHSEEGNRRRKRKMTTTTIRSPHGTPRHPLKPSPIQLGSLSTTGVVGGSLPLLGGISNSPREYMSSCCRTRRRY